MIAIEAWGDDLVAAGGEVALESLAPEMGAGAGAPCPPSNFKPVNITVDNGSFHATIYVCHCVDDSMKSQQLCVWLGSLKETDQVNLTVLSLVNEIPLSCVINLLTALTATRAKLNIKLDQVVYDNLAYFYLIPEQITKGSEGALFIPSYMVHRSQDASGPSRAVHDFFAWLTAEAVTKKILTSEEADRLDRGSHVAVPDDRFGVAA